MPKSIVTSPTEEPVTLVELKEELRIDSDNTDFDVKLTRGIKAARERAEHYLDRALITQTWDLFMDRFADAIEIPLPPLQSVSSITYIDDSGVQQTLSTDVYTVDTAAEPGIVRLAYGQAWPSVRCQANAVTIRFVAGYGDQADVPDDIKEAILTISAERHENPAAELSPAVQSLLWPYRVLRVA
jgi:uncharacterized phiE125 gp8 family phage protein